MKRLLTLAALCLLPAGAHAQGNWHGDTQERKAAPAPAVPPAPVARAARRFEPPTVNGIVVDQCEVWSRNCGDGGAKAFCRLRGYERVLRWEHARPGRTWVIGSAQACEGDFCTGYRYVECAGYLPVAAAGTRRFEPALFNGLPVDNCERWATNCGEPGAHAFCKAQGFARALQWEFIRPGRTWVIGSNRSCEGEGCVAFRYVVCNTPP